MLYLFSEFVGIGWSLPRLLPSSLFLIECIFVRQLFLGMKLGRRNCCFFAHCLRLFRLHLKIVWGTCRQVGDVFCESTVSTFEEQTYDGFRILLLQILPGPFWFHCLKFFLLFWFWGVGRVSLLLRTSVSLSRLFSFDVKLGVQSRAGSPTCVWWLLVYFRPWCSPAIYTTEAGGRLYCCNSKF